MLLSRSGDIDIAGRIDSNRGNFFLGRAVENKRLAIGRDAIDQPAAIRAGNQISLGIDCQNANVDFIALEEKCVLAARADFIDFAMIAGSHI